MAVTSSGDLVGLGTAVAIGMGHAAAVMVEVEVARMRMWCVHAAYVLCLSGVQDGAVRRQGGHRLGLGFFGGTMG